MVHSLADRLTTLGRKLFIASKKIPSFKENFGRLWLLGGFYRYGLGIKGEWGVRSFAKQTRRVLRSVGPSCGEQGNRERLLLVVFFADDFREVEW